MRGAFNSPGERAAQMELLSAETPLSVLSGFVVGLLVELTGVGGGSLMTPLLILLFGTPATTAVGTDLLYAAATKSVGAWPTGASRPSTGGSPAAWQWAAFRARC